MRFQTQRTARYVERGFLASARVYALNVDHGASGDRSMSSTFLKWSLISKYLKA